MSDDLQHLAVGAETSYESTSLWDGTIWQSARKNGPKANLESTVPGGLHIGIGAAKISSHSKDFGTFEVKGPVITALCVPEDGAVFRSKLKAGPVHSFGIHLPTRQLEKAEPALADILKVMRGRPMVAIQGDIANELRRLCAPLEPWFDAPSREMLLQSRALELVAVASSVLVERSKRDTSRPEMRCAYDVRDEIDADLTASVKLEELARRRAVSIRFMTDAFRSAFGESIGAYLTRRRMENAARLIRDGASVTQTAYMVGYKPNSFSTAFKRHFGYPPSRIFG